MIFGLAAAASAQPIAALAAAAPAAPLTSERLLTDATRAAERGDDVAALQLFQAAIVHGAATPEPYLGIARFHAENNEPGLAERYYGTVLELDPANAAALNGLGLLELAKGNRAAAEARYALLVRACGQTCPEAVQLNQALNIGPALNSGTPN